MTHSVIEWQWCRIDDLTSRQQYAIYAAREAVFVVEQHCIYQELDGLDLDAHHLVGWCDREVAAYLRLIAPGLKFDEPSIGRVMTSLACRRTGLGRQMMSIALERAAQLHPQHGIRISAQVYLEAFYRSFGFVPCSKPYLEDGIPHVEMLRAWVGPSST